MVTSREKAADRHPLGAFNVVNTGGDGVSAGPSGPPGLVYCPAGVVPVNVR